MPFLIEIAVNLMSRSVGHLWHLLAVLESRVASVLPEIEVGSAVVP